MLPLVRARMDSAEIATSVGVATPAVALALTVLAAMVASSALVTANAPNSKLVPAALLRRYCDPPLAVIAAITPALLAARPSTDSPGRFCSLAKVTLAVLRNHDTSPSEA